MKKIMEKIALEHIILMMAFFIFFGVWAIALMPIILMWHDIKKYRTVVIFIVVVCIGYTFGKTLAERHNETYKAEMSSHSFLAKHLKVFCSLYDKQPVSILQAKKRQHNLPKTFNV
ncbi:hypothetical protein [Alishewanella sp. SMS8]|uniref:hypothetical protein n=1 Tax=Alishewanella sp. SMS8 TaxID=2994676 RepID=UPI002742358F|nr:hypothetical protein [Alishewanella sp. SMS8]MDP5207741.1 hypothetical protein [Alishewanella sp. SMS9]MDP5458960.1 hypothetical protein [Alishewanella sp. SMS8]